MDVPNGYWLPASLVKPAPTTCWWAAPMPNSKPAGPAATNLSCLCSATAPTPSQATVALDSSRGTSLAKLLAKIIQGWHKPQARLPTTTFQARLEQALHLPNSSQQHPVRPQTVPALAQAKVHPPHPRFLTRRAQARPLSMWGMPSRPPRWPLLLDQVSASSSSSQIKCEQENAQTLERETYKEKYSRGLAVIAWHLIMWTKKIVSYEKTRRRGSSSHP